MGKMLKQKPSECETKIKKLKNNIWPQWKCDRSTDSWQKCDMKEVDSSGPGQSLNTFLKIVLMYRGPLLL